MGVVRHEGRIEENMITGRLVVDPLRPVAAGVVLQDGDTLLEFPAPAGVENPFEHHGAVTAKIIDRFQGNGHHVGMRLTLILVTNDVKQGEECSRA